MADPLILVADDSQLIRAMLGDALRRQGYRVAEAEDGNDALRAFQSLRPDVVLLDVEMPGMDGHEVLRRVKQEPLLQDTPVVFLSGRVEIDDVVRGLRLGAHDYLRKPVGPPELLARVSAALRVKLLQDELRRRNAELDLSARVDGLTGLYNRRQLDHELDRTFSIARRRSEAPGTLMIDVDHFKRINDSLGHLAGDVVLREVTNRLRLSVRNEDVLGRWGGDEFLIVCSGATPERLAVIAERARRAVSATPVEVDALEARADAMAEAMAEATAEVEAAKRPPHDSVTVTITIGGALGLDGGPEGLVRRADFALYRAKNGGRDRFVIATDDGGAAPAPRD